MLGEDVPIVSAFLKNSLFERWCLREILAFDSTMEELFAEALKLFMGGYADPHRLRAAFRVFEENYEAGTPRAAYMLGRCYYEGLHVARDFERAGRIFEDGAEHGSLVCTAMLFVMERRRQYFSDKPLRGDFGSGARLIHALAQERHDPEALFICAEIAYWFENRLGTAMDCYKAAADAGHAQAMYQFGMEKMNMGEEDDGIAYIKRAAGRGHPLAELTAARL